MLVNREGAEENIWTLEEGRNRRLEKKLRNEEFNTLCSLPSIIRMMKSRMRLAGRMGETRNSYKI
jgi:hypothetical protein